MVSYFKGAQNQGESTKVGMKKHRLQQRILQFLYFHGPCTNDDICRALEISAPTLKRYLSQFEAMGWVLRSGNGESAGGRKPRLYSLKQHRFYFMAIQLTQFQVRMAIYDTSNTKIGCYEEELPSGSNSKLTARIFEKGGQLLKESFIAQKNMLGIALSMSNPGPFQRKAGSQDNGAHSFGELLKKRFGKPVLAMDPGSSSCFAEASFGAAKARDNVLVISLDWDITCGMVLDGKVHQDNSGFMDRLAHIPFVDEGQLCHCGKTGCLETVASGRALVQLAREGLAKGEASSLHQLPVEQLTPEAIIDAANKGDGFSVKLLSQIGVSLGKAIATLIQLLNPELVILQGKFAKAKQLITIPVQQSLNTYCMPQFREKASLALSELDEDSILLGSMAGLMNNLLGEDTRLT